METLREASLRNFENDLVEHVKTLAPKLCEIRGDTTVREVVRIGIARASNYGFETRGPVRLYVDLIFTTGIDFDSDPQLPWASEVLEDASIEDAEARADALFAGYQQYREAVAGPDNKFLLDALKRVRRERFDESAQGGGSDGIINGLRALYPQKADYTGPDRLRRIVSLARECAAALSIQSHSGVALLSGLMFGFGHSVAKDPLYPWVGSTLRDANIEDESGRVARLRDKTMVYIDRLIENLGN